MFGPLYRAMARVVLERCARAGLLPTRGLLNLAIQKLNEGQLGDAIDYFRMAIGRQLTPAQRNQALLVLDFLCSEIDSHIKKAERTGRFDPSLARVFVPSLRWHFHPSNPDVSEGIRILRSLRERVQRMAEAAGLDP